MTGITTFLRARADHATDALALRFHRAALAAKPPKLSADSGVNGADSTHALLRTHLKKTRLCKYGYEKTTTTTFNQPIRSNDFTKAGNGGVLFLLFSFLVLFTALFSVLRRDAQPL